MNCEYRLRVFTTSLAVLFALAMVARAQEAPEPPADARVKPTTSALGVRQDHVKRMMQDLEEKFVDLARTLEKTEPAQAARLVQALQQSKQSLIETRMTKIAQLLNETRFDNATDEQKQVVTDLKRLIRILLEDDKDADKLQAEIDRLEKWRGQINELIREETDEKRESERVSEKEKTLAELARQIAALEDLIKKQQQVIANTGQARGEGVQALGKVADEQRAVRGETEKLAAEIGKPRADDAPAAGEKPGEPSEPGEVSREAKAERVPPGEGKEGAPAKDGKSLPDGGGKPSQPGAKESDSGEGKEGAESDSGAPAGAEPGQRPLQQAIKEQKGAEGNLEKGKGKAAEQNEQQALADLNRALAELKKEQARIASLPPEALDQMAQAQDATAEKTGDLSEDMKKAGQEAGAPSGEQSGDGQSGDGQSGEGQAGQKQVGEAQEAMKDASGKLGKKDPKQAGKDQKKAVKKLKDARDEIEERLAQLRKEMQAEKLAALEARFREMLQKQQPVTKSTLAIDSQRAGGKLRRADRLTLVKLSAEELAIGELAQQALDIIVEDGTSVVFAHVTEQLRDDLRGVGDLLHGERTDGYVQSQQQEIERTLAELIEALQKAQEQSDSEGDSEAGEQGDDNEPLLPNSAELKLLKAAQLRVNRRTTSFEENRPMGELEALLKKEVRAISQRQEDVAKMAEELGTKQ